MATKDRTSLKDEFKNGNLATGERFADLIDSVKVVQLPVVDPQALGSTSSFIDSISQDADGKITATKKNVVLNYVNIQDKPQINGHTLNGNMSSKELGIINQIQLNDGTAIYPDQDGNVKLPVIPQTTNTITPGSTNVPTADAVDEALEEQNLLVPKAAPYTAPQKYNASANINDRSADVVVATGEVKALGYKILNPQQRFSSQVTATNTIFEIRDEFDLNKVVTDVEKECTVSTNISSTSTPNIYYIDNTPIVMENGNGVKLPTGCVLLNSAKNMVSYSDTTPIHVTTGTFYVASKTSGTYTIIIYDNVITVPDNSTLKFNGGKLSNGTINFNNCYIDSPNVQIFGMDMEFSNVNVKNTELVATWFGFTPENTDVTQLNKIIAFGCNVFIPKGEYLLTSSIVKTTGDITNIYGESRATILRSTTCDIFNVRYIRIESFQIKAEGYYGVKVNGSGVKVIDNDIRRCAVGIGNELTTPNKMENEIANNTIQYCSDSGIKYHGSSTTGGYGYISGLKIHDNYIVKAGTGVDDYTTPGTEGLGYGIYIENIFSGTVEKNVCEYCSHSGIYIKYSEYITLGLFVRNNAFEQNKRAQIVLDISTAFSSIRGLEIRDNHSSYPHAKVSNFIKEYNITGTYAYGIFTTEYNNKAFGFDGNNSFGKNINTLYENISKLSDIGGNTLSHALTANGIEFYKGDNIASLPIMAVEPGVYRIKYTMKRTTTPTGGTDVSSGYLRISAKCGSDTVNMSNATLTTAMGAKDFSAFINVQSTGYLYLTAYIENGSALPEDMPLFTINNVSVEKYALSAVTRSTIRGMYSDLKGLSIFDDSLNKVISYDGTKWIDEDGEAAGIRRTGTSSQRPNLTNIGFKYFDTTLGKPIFWNGTAWVDGNGEPVGLQVSDTSILIGAAADSTKTVSVYYGGSTAPTITVLNADDTANTWLTTALVNNTLTLTAAANTTSAPRGAKVLVTLGDDELVIINVIQTQPVSNE